MELKTIFDFIHAALPWIAIGLLLAVFLARSVTGKKKEEQIEDYAKAEGTDKRIFVYVQVGNPKRDETIQKRHQ